MCSSRAASVAVRRPSGEVVSRVRHRSRKPFWAWARRVPFLRGLVTTLESAGLYVSASLFAFNQSDLFRPLGSAAVGGEDLPGFAPSAARSLRAWRLVLAWLFWVSLGLVLVLGGVPLIFAEVAKGAPDGLASAACHTLGACAATLLMAGYVSLVGHSYSLSALLAYHGAEHQVRAAYDACAPLTLAKVRMFAPFSSGCVMGRAVVVTLMGFGVAFVGAAVCGPVNGILSAADGSWGHLMGATAVRGVAVILATGLYGEMRRLVNRFTGAPGHDHALLAGPATWLCAASTTLPTEAQTEVALVALMRLMDAQQAGRTSGYKTPVGFRKLADACVRLGQATQHRAVMHGAKETRGA